MEIRKFLGFQTLTRSSLPKLHWHQWRTNPLRSTRICDPIPSSRTHLADEIPTVDGWDPHVNVARITLKITMFWCLTFIVLLVKVY
jgi:hypothetical protein